MEFGFNSNGSSDVTPASESFLSEVAFESNSRKKLARTEHVLIVEVCFRTKKTCESFHDTRARFLSKVTFERDFRKKTFPYTLPSQVVRVISHKVASPPHMAGSIVFTRFRQCAPPSNSSFPRRIRVHDPKGISIGSAVFAQLAAEYPYILH